MKLSALELEALYAKVQQVRLCEQQIMKEYFQDEMKTPVHLGIGCEAIGAGVHFGCPTGTQYFGTYRNHALYLACSNDLESFFGEMYGKMSGCGKGKAGSMHMACPEHGLIATSAVVGTTIPVAAGAALAQQYHGTGKIVVCQFGDGAVEEGVFFETLNFASLKNLPLLLVCEDNELAIHSSREERKGFKSFADIAKTFGIEFGEGNGSVATEVVGKTRDIVARMKSTGRPGFLHFNYFRFLEHVGPLEDFDKGYRKKPADAVAQWDPVTKLRADCLAGGVSAARLDAIDADLLERIAKAVMKAKSESFPPPDELFTDVFSSSLQEAH